MIATIDASNWIYKIVPINDDHLLCGGDGILMVLEANNFTVIVKEKTQSWVMDIVRVNKENEYALACAEGINFIKIDPVTLAIQQLPLQLNNNHSRINKIRDNILLISHDGSNLFIFDTLNQMIICEC